MTTIQYNWPKDVSQYKDQYILFLGEEKNPKVIFHTPFADEAYKKAQEQLEKNGKMPIVERVTEKNCNFFNEK